ncbi:MAG: TonB family protein [Verrucomicrobiales bacterium]|nr:TonB family protein [Verrucomicrobiales bacterium]
MNKVAAPNSEIPRRAQVIEHAGKRGDGLLLPVATLVLWLGCLAIGWIGFVLPYARPRPPVKQPEPIQAEVLNVELTNEPLPPPDAPPSPADTSEPPPLNQPTGPPQAPPMIAVAEPTPAVAFALPVEAPTRIVEVGEASYARQTEPIAPAPAPPVQAITYGQGEGRQPAPEYPRQAIREGQEGNVTVRMSVGENGRVLAAEAVSPSPWPLLNESALRAVRQRWRFRPGPLRLYEVSIRFELKKL